ncbi:MAG: hypothetical protein LAP38_08155 [Acidobacteriia bacterium]|nr:hypothetical protein [Terriglobia bacterium]
MKDENVPVSSTDELTVAGGRLADRVRHLGEYKPTNTPLSAVEIALRKHLGEARHVEDWTPRTRETIRDLTPRG